MEEERTGEGKNRNTEVDRELAWLWTEAEHMSCLMDLSGTQRPAGSESLP